MVSENEKKEARIMIKVKGLYHSYLRDDNFAVKDVNFEVADGEIFGFLGPSGAGKSTTQGILTGLLQLQKGDVSVAGYDIKNISPLRTQSAQINFII